MAKPQVYQRGANDTWHEIEAALLEATDDYVHRKISIHGSLAWSMEPTTASFLIYRESRIEI